MYVHKNETLFRDFILIASFTLGVIFIGRCVLFFDWHIYVPWIKEHEAIRGDSETVIQPLTFIIWRSSSRPCISYEAVD